MQFKLGTFSAPGGAPYPAMVFDDRVIGLAALQDRYRGSLQARAGALAGAASLFDLLQDWDHNFAVLLAMAEFAAAEGLVSPRIAPICASLGMLTVHPPMPRPGKMLHSAANYRGHVVEMREYSHSQGQFDRSKSFSGDKTQARPYFFLKAASALIGAYDDILLPEGAHQIDWEVELAAVIGRRARRVGAGAAMAHVAGYMTTNDLSCRDLLFRDDRQTFRTDWFASKSLDTFAPTGPFFVPRAFIPDHGAVRLRLKVNGTVRQDGSTADMIFGCEEQVEYLSHLLTLEPGDVIATGTTAGVGQATGTYLAAGDLVEAEVEGVGAQRNRVVAAPEAG